MVEYIIWGIERRNSLQKRKFFNSLVGWPLRAGLLKS